MKHETLRRSALAALLITILGYGVAAAADDPPARSVLVEVAAGRHPRRETPVMLPLPPSLARAAARGYLLTELGQDQDQAQDRTVASQVLALPGMAPRLVWIIRDRLPAGATRRYRLEPADPARPARAEATCISDGTHLRLHVGGRPVLQYNAVLVEPPSGIEAYYRRSGQIHPLFTPSGGVVSDDFPPDHAHQHGVFFAWVNTTFQGRHLDFWNQKEHTARIEHVATLGMCGGPVFGQFQVRLRHDDLTAPGGPQPVLDEVWTVRAYNVSDVFLVDFESRQTCAGSSPLMINKYHYGGMGLRASRAWFDPEVKGNSAPDPARSGRSDFLTSEGKDRATGNHTRPFWVDVSGQLGEGSGAGGSSGGVALLDHPGNFGYPQPVRLHPNKPYFCFAPMVLGPFEIAPGQPYVSRYRFVIHDGTPDAAALELAWQDYADPPAVRVVTEP